MITQELNTKSGVKIIISMRCAGYLMYNGCKLVRIEPHKKFQNKNVFVFNDDEKTNAFLHQYTKEVSQKDEPKEIYFGADWTRV